jgi:hypothetical protein
MNRSQKFRETSARRQGKKACEHVGNFLLHFAWVSSVTEELFYCKFNLDSFTSMILTHHIPLRKKLELLQYAFERQGISCDKSLDRVNFFHDIRNAIAHSAFEHSPSFTVTRGRQKIYYPAGVQFDWVDRQGRLRLPNLSKIRKEELKKIQRIKEGLRRQIRDKDKLTEAEGDADWLLEERTISYKYFDQYEKEMWKLMLDISGLDASPVNEGIHFAQDVAKIIAASDNVLPFYTPPFKR